MTDVFKTASILDQGLSIGVAITTDTCHEAARVHQLQATSAIALGRLLTCTAERRRRRARVWGWRCFPPNG